MLKLLLIEDEEPTRRALGRTLKSDGYQVLTAEDGKKGIELFTQEKPPIVLTDIKMPGIDGIEVLKRIKALDNEVEVIVITGHGDMDSAIEALKNGASDFITKPIRDEVLTLALERAKKKIAISQELKGYTENLEQKIEECTLELRQAQEELIRNERLATIGETVAGVAHYIKNILHGLRGGVYMVNTGMPKDAPGMLKEGWARVQSNVEKISDLVLNLLTYSKERTPERSVCRPNEIVSEVVELLKEVAEEHHVQLSMFLDPNLKEAYLDRDGIHRVLLNLVSNAIDACTDDMDTSKSWEVTVKTKLQTGAEGDRITLFEVTDNGSGMTDEVKAKLFTRFFSTKGGRGTGLGLLNAQKIVHEHGGEITVESKTGKGTTFSVRLKEAMPNNVLR
jgi:signal transduction histidine kinase